MLSSCPTSIELDALLNGTLPAARSALIEEHLGECRACRQRLDALTGGNATSVRLESAGDSPVPSPQLREVLQRLKLANPFLSPGPSSEMTRAPGTRLRYLGDYEILDELGRGGMGVVYRARQLSLQRDVALKVILAGELASPSAVRRFQVEAEAAAKLDHPHIVPIFEIGEHEGHHFYSMKLVVGGALAERISSSKSQLSQITNRETAKLLATIARAVHYAHQRGVLHRDLKPGNILLDDAGAPHVTDFGLAKLIERDSSLTHSAAIMGSPNYMAPEHVAGRAREATTATDVYSLGAILYELLTGCPPFRSESPIETLRLVAEAEAPSPARLNPAVPPDLATICLKCLEKDPARRYASAGSLADELDRFCRGEPILARPVARAERLWRWCRRQPALAGSLAALILVFVAGFAGVLWKWRGELHQRRLAQQAVTRLEIERAESLLQVGDTSRGLAYLARLLRQQPTNSVVADRLLNALTYRSLCLPVAPLRHGNSLNSLTGERKEKLANRFAFQKPGSLVAANFSPDSARIVTAAKDGTARIWNTYNGDPIGPPLQHDAEVLWAEFSGDGRRVITASVDGTAKIWAADTGELTTPPLWHENIVHHAAFSPDGQKVITASRDKTVRVWSTQTGHPIGAPMLHPASPYFACFSPDGNRILTADHGPEVDLVRLWDAHTRAELASAEHFYFVGSSAPYPLFSPSLDQVVTLLWHAAQLRSTTSDLARSALLMHDGYCMGAAYSPDGKWIATVSSDTTARIWDARSGETTVAPLRHDARVSMADFSADGQQLLTASLDKSARLWESRSGQALTEPLRQELAVLAAKISPGGQRVATLSETDSAWLWDVRRLQPLTVLRRLPIVPIYTRFSRDNRQLLVVDESDMARVWNARTGEFQSKRMTHATNSIIVDAQFSPDGRRLHTSSEDRTIQAWDPSTGAPLGPRWPQPRTARRIRFSPDGRQLATASEDGMARLLDAETGRLILQMRHSKSIASVEFSLDGTLIVTASADATAQIWDASTGRPKGPALRHDAAVYHAEFDREVRRVATASMDKTVRIWSVATGQMLTPPLMHADALQRTDSVTFNPEGSRLATAAGNVVQVWDTGSGRAITRPIRHGGLIRSMHFSPNGRKLLTASEDGAARLWDPETGHPVSEILRHGGGVTSAEFSPDGTRVVTCAADMAVRVWEVISAPLPGPDWLPALAEAVAAQRVDGDESVQTVPVEELFGLREKLAANPEQNDYGRWTRWFFADGATRTISPSFEATVPQYVQRRVEDNTRESLREATLLSPTNVIAFARYAENLSAIQISGPRRARAVPEDAEWFSRYATNLAPSNPEALRIRTLVLERLKPGTNAPTP